MQASRKKGLTGSTLKIIAIVLMFIDHFAAIVLDRVMIARIRVDLTHVSKEAAEAFIDGSYLLYDVTMAMRFIGRGAFPIFAFLLVEGMCHTRNKRKYLGQLLAFAVVSELPFNLGFKNALLEPDYQNVFFTLFLGACAIALISQVEKQNHLNGFMKSVARCAVVGLCMMGAYLGCTDYGAYGVLTIAVMYVLRGKKVAQGLVGCSVLTMMNPIEAYAYPVTILFGCYNEERGLKMKYIFYLFYPAHILLLYGIGVIFW